MYNNKAPASTTTTPIPTGTLTLPPAPTLAQPSPLEPANLTTATTVKTQLSSSSSTTTALSQKAPVDSKELTVDQAIANLGLYEPGTWRVIDDLCDDTNKDEDTSRISRFKWLLLKLPRHDFKGAEGLQIFSLRIALHKIKDKYSVVITPPTNTDIYSEDASESIQTSIQVTQKLGTLSANELCQVTHDKGKEDNWWRVDAIDALQRKFSKANFTDKQVSDAKKAETKRAAVVRAIKGAMNKYRETYPTVPLKEPQKSEDLFEKFFPGSVNLEGFGLITLENFKEIKKTADFFYASKERLFITPIEYAPRQLCDSLANAAEAMTNNGCLVRNQSADAEARDVKKRATYAARNAFRYSSMHALKLSHTTIIGEIPNAGNTGGQDSVKIETIRIIPLNIVSETLLITMTNTGYGDSLPNSETISFHAEMLSATIKNLADKKLLVMADFMRELYQPALTNDKWLYLLRSVNLNPDMEKKDVMAALHSALVYCKILQCAEKPADKELKRELLSLLPAARAYGSDVAWSLLSTLTRTRQEHETCDLLAWHPDLKGTDDLGFPASRVSAGTRQMYMDADLNIMNAELANDKNLKAKAVSESKNLDRLLTTAHGDFMEHCKDVIRSEIAQRRAAKPVKLIDTKSTVLNTNTHATPNANVPPSAVSSSAVGHPVHASTPTSTTAPTPTPAQLPTQTPRPLLTSTINTATLRVGVTESMLPAPPQANKSQLPCNVAESLCNFSPFATGTPGGSTTRIQHTSKLLNPRSRVLSNFSNTTQGQQSQIMMGRFGKMTLEQQNAMLQQMQAMNGGQQTQSSSSSSTTVTHTMARNPVVDKPPVADETAQTLPTNGQRY